MKNEPKFIKAATVASAAIVAVPLAMATSSLAGEAPVLAAKVAAGSLPALADRVGAEPRVVEPVDEVGTYGGTHSAALVGGNDRNMLLKFTGYEPLLAWDREWSGALVPNVAKSYVASEDASSYTFTLRDGMRWSNGMAYGAEDIAFVINDILGDDTLYPSKPSWLMAGGELPTATVLSPTEVRIDFAAPNGLFAQNVATPNGTILTMMSHEYCGQFIPSMSDKAESLASAAGAADWAEHLRNMCGLHQENIERWRNPDMPTINAFMIEQPYVSGATQVTLERNPYYWKVDTAGNQLPYIDNARFSINADRQTALLAAVAGETTFQQRHIASALNLPVLAAAQDDAGIQIVPRVLDRGSNMTISFNLSHPDEATRDIFDDVDFRAAMSHAINRQAVIDSLYLGLGEPTQPGPASTSPYYNEQLDTQYLAYDVEKANSLLDGLGYDKRDQNNFRLAPSGQRIQFNVQAVNALGSYSDIAELVTQYWQAVGVDARVQTMDRTRFYEVKNANEHDVVIWGAGGNGPEGLLDPRHYLPFSSESNFGVGWVKWMNSDGADGVEPPAWAKEQVALYTQITETADLDKQTELFKEILQIAADNFFVIGISTPVQNFAVKSKSLANVTENTPIGWIYPNPGPSNPEQWFFKN